MADDLINRLKIDLVSDEGTRLQVYDDATGDKIVPGYTLKGKPTIGIGRCLSTKGLSQEESFYLLENDIKEVVADCVRNFAWFSTLTLNRQKAVCNIVFELGITGFLSFRKTIAALSAGNWRDASDCLLNSVYAEQVPDRAKRIADLIVIG